MEYTGFREADLITTNFSIRNERRRPCDLEHKCVLDLSLGLFILNTALKIIRVIQIKCRLGSLIPLEESSKRSHPIGWLRCVYAYAYMCMCVRVCVCVCVCVRVRVFISFVEKDNPTLT